MKIETLKDRINKAEEKIEKLNKTLERHQKTLDKKVTILIKKGIDMNNYDKFDKGTRNNDIYWELCDYENKLEDIKKTKEKISEAKIKFNKYKEQLNNQVAKDLETESLIPECLNIFLENWKQKCINFYINLANKYIEIEFKEYEVTREELRSLVKKRYNSKIKDFEIRRMYTDEEIEKIFLKENECLYNNAKSQIHYKYFNNFKKSLFASDSLIIAKIVDYDTINKGILNKILDDDVQAKKETFIKRIKSVIGDITDLSNLKIGGNGEINGIAKGAKANAKVETITAGGYNIQCYHFRVLVNTIK